MGVCNCSIFYCTLLCVHSSIAIILFGTRELVALLNLSSWCLVMIKRLFLAVQGGFQMFVIVVFPDHTHLLFLMKMIPTFDNSNCPSEISILVSVPGIEIISESPFFTTCGCCWFDVTLIPKRSRNKSII